MWTLQLKYAQRARELNANEIKAFLEQIVDEHAKAKVDRVVHCVISIPFGGIYPWYKPFGQCPRGWLSGLERFHEGGYDLLQTLLDRSHKDGMQFLAGFRMNDRHGGSLDQPFAKKYPEWQLKELDAGMDYKYEGVRNAVLAFTEEFLAKYDVDGIELDWMRWCHVFNPSEAKKNAPILTDFMTDMRRVVNQAGRKRGRRGLLLGIRIPQTLEECKSLGFDVKAWVQSDLIDYMCPSDFFFTDFNIRTEDFVKLTKGTPCKVYPSIHPLIANGNAHQVHDAASYAAAANNYYAFGADGISVYNYQYHWRSDMGSEDEWPRALSYLTRLRDRKSVSKLDRHYLYHPLWPPGSCPTGASKYDSIELDRSKVNVGGLIHLRIAEDLTEPHLSAVLEFKVTGMTEGDEIAARLNGRDITAMQMKLIRAVDGQSAEQGRTLPAFHLYRIALSYPPTKFGDNELHLRLTKSAGKQTPVAQEFEILVHDTQAQ